MTREDFLREQRIELARFDIEDAGTPEVVREAWDRMRAEIQQRRPEFVTEMECERGLQTCEVSQ